MTKIEEKLMQINNLKLDLMNIGRCIDSCAANEICYYQDLAITYSMRLKKLKEFINQEYGVNICCDCKSNKLET